MSKRKLPVGKYIDEGTTQTRSNRRKTDYLQKAEVYVPEAINVLPEKYSISVPEANAYNTKSSYVEGLHPINVESLVDAQRRGEVTRKITPNIQHIIEEINNLSTKIKHSKNEKKKDLRTEKEVFKRRLEREIENLKYEQAMLDMDYEDKEYYSRLRRQKDRLLKSIIKWQKQINDYEASIKVYPAGKEKYKQEIEKTIEALSKDTNKLQEIEGKIKGLDDDLYQYGSERRHEQRREVFPRGGKKTRRRLSTKKRHKTKTSHKTKCVRNRRKYSLQADK